MDLPIVFNLDIAIKGEADMPYRWDDNYGARLGVLRRDDPFGEIRWFEIDPCYVFHVANAYDDGNSIVLQAVRYPELWRNNGGFEVDGVMWSWTIDLAAGTVDERQLDDRGVEFPRIDDRLAGLPARTPSRSATATWSATTSTARPQKSIDSPANPEKPSTCHRARVNCRAGTWPTCTTRRATAATWSSSTRRTSPANPLRACGFRSACRTGSTATGSPTSRAAVEANRAVRTRPVRVGPRAPRRAGWAA